VEGEGKKGVLQAILGTMPLPGEIDRQQLLEVLLARESLGSTGIGDGIAIPHVRNPIVMPLPQPLIRVSFLKQAVDFGALDGRPVHTLFTLISPTIRIHLRLLSELAFALRQPDFMEVISRRATAQEILEWAGRIDRSLSHPAGPERSKER
jgi:PTS system nitrogen regulatory IIA component